MSYELETLKRVYDNEHGIYHEVRPGEVPGIVELRTIIHEGGKEVEEARMTFNEESLPLIIQALQAFLPEA